MRPVGLAAKASRNVSSVLLALRRGQGGTRSMGVGAALTMALST
ncbi:hypothetical protein FOFC_16087 [Fusarium oxysporum]|nr:hypothetical protein FOFC_16087 [Fusarium oxysporum]